MLSKYIHIVLLSLAALNYDVHVRGGQLCCIS